MSAAETAAASVPQAGAVARAERRATVGRLAQEEGLSARAIAARLGISKDTVRRDLAGLAQGGAPGDAPPAAPGAPVAPLGEPGGAVAHGGRLVLELYQGLAEDLATLQRTGCTAEAAVDYAVATLAGAYRRALELGVLSDGDPLDVLAVTFQPPARAATGAQ